MTGGEVLYVYYKVEVARHAALAPQVRQFQAGLQQAWPGLECELLQRPEARDGVETWMETYRQAGGLHPGLAAAITQAAVAAGLPTARHVESFVPLR